MSAVRVQEPPARTRPQPRFITRRLPRAGVLRVPLGIVSSTRFADYGPTSHFSESMLFHAYRRADVDEGEP